MRRLLAAVAVLTFLTGCGGSPPSVVTVADRAPALAERLDRIDRALVEGRWAVARRALEAMVADTRRAERTGEVDAATADRILAAARRLLALLPAPRESADMPVTSPDAEPTEQPSRKPSAPTTTTAPSAAPEVPEPSAPVTEAPADPTPTPEPTPEPSREATPTEQASPAVVG